MKRSPGITIEQATRAVLRGEQHVPTHDDQAGEEEARRGSRPKVSLPHVRWIELPGPAWTEPPQPKRARGRRRP
jgi:hypothetical protein